MAFFETDNQQLKEAFDWATQKIKTWVVPAGQIGPVNEGHAPAAKYIPCFVAGHRTRTCFFSRDYVHSVYGAEFFGLKEECYHMLRAFAKSAWKSRNYYAIWSINFDGETPHIGDYFNEDSFVREIPMHIILGYHILIVNEDYILISWAIGNLLCGVGKDVVIEIS